VFTKLKAFVKDIQMKVDSVVTSKPVQIAAIFVRETVNSTISLVELLREVGLAVGSVGKAGYKAFKSVTESYNSVMTPIEEDAPKHTQHARENLTESWKSLETAWSHTGNAGDAVWYAGYYAKRGAEPVITAAYQALPSMKDMGTVASNALTSAKSCATEVLSMFPKVALVGKVSI
jgi:hypothetical protein